MPEQVIVRGPGEGRALLVGGGDFVTYKARSEETGGAYFCFEVSTAPGFGPPLHEHAYRELFYVLEGAYEFTIQRGDDLETVTGAAGTSVAIPPNVRHTFRNATDRRGRLLFVHQPAALEEFFEEFGVPVPHAGEVPVDVAPPAFGAMAAALQRNGVHVVEPGPVG
ncbi:MAG TPA: cupin domain-containing protein [Solirubrobacteraceae bacterium]|jgi:quercetin dioxygenase-like cupin family protein|nr:cupin domain-containing protein [Solirubrobacteraceae bacterium]